MFLGAAIDDQVTNLVVAQLLFLEAEDPEKPINLYINSPGGDMVGLFAIHDTMHVPAARRWRRPASARPRRPPRCSWPRGTPGMRSALPNARVLIHQPHGGAQGQSVDIEIQVRETIEMRERMVDILVTATGQTRERIVADIDRDYIVRGEEAVAYGLVDEIISARRLHPVAAITATSDGA